MHSISPLLLAIDTSTRAVGLAIYDGVLVLAESTWNSQDHHTVELAPAVAETLRRAGIRPPDLQAIGVALGPGSFTGLRIGLALAKGLALVRRLPLVGIPTLDALAAAQPVSDLPMAALLRAGRGRLAVQWYQAGGDERGETRAWKATKTLEVLTAQELSNKIQSPTLICGELTEEERRILARKRRNVILASPAQSLRRPGYLAEQAWTRWQAGQVDDPAVLSPVYLHYNDPIPG